MLVEEVMGEPYAIEKDMSLMDAVKLMNKHNTDSLIFLVKGAVKGIITERDILKNYSEKKKVSQVMTKGVIVVQPDKEIDDALHIMQENKVKRLPVVDEGELVGIITTTDILVNADELDDEEFFF